MKKNHQTKDSSAKPFKIRLPGFIGDEEIGLGDVVTNVTSAVGIKPCGGCKRRAMALNRWVSFKSRN